MEAELRDAFPRSTPFRWTTWRLPLFVISSRVEKSLVVLQRQWRAELRDATFYPGATVTDDPFPPSP